MLGTGCLVLMVLALPFLLGRTSVSVDLRLQPERVAAGESVAAGVLVVNRASSRLVPTTLEVPVGSAVHRYGISSLAPGATHEESFTIRTERRGVIAVGPAMTRRGDPVGIFSRDVVWTPVREVLVRPHLVPMESLGAGLLRDLEGVSTDAVSQSDLAFHALREYVPGDDLRHIHWRSSAKVMASTRRVGPARAPVPRHPPQPRHDRRRRPARARGPTRRTSRPRWRSRRRSPCGRCSTSSTSPSCAARTPRRAPTATSRSTPSAAPTSATAASSSPGARPACWLPTPASRSSSAAASRRSPTCCAPRRPSRPRCAASASSSTPQGNSRVTETGGLPVLHLAAKEDLGGLLRWSVR